MSGELFETFIVSEIMKSYMNAGKDLDKIYFYRDKEKRDRPADRRRQYTISYRDKKRSSYSKGLDEKLRRIIRNQGS